MKRIPAAVVLMSTLLVAPPLPCRADGGLLLREVTDECGLGGKGGDRFSFGDYDGDGDPDMLVGASRLYRNDSRPGKLHFTDVTTAAGLEGAGGGGAPAGSTSTGTGTSTS